MDMAQKWIAAWGSSQLIAANETLPPEPYLKNNTYRQAVRLSIGGQGLRIRFTNEYGETPLVMESVHIAKLLTPGSSTVDLSTDQVITFSGTGSVTIPAKESLWSDILEIPVKSLEYLAVTIKFGEVPTTITSHTASRSTNWLVAGNHVTEETLNGYSTTTSWYFLSDMETRVAESARVLVCFGDSITDGYGTTTDVYNRWTDQLAVRLQKQESTRDVAVINRGIGGNAIWGGNGPAAVSRFDRDVFGTTGVSYVIILIGINDIGFARQDISGQIIAQLSEWTKKCHDKGIRVFGGTILPFRGNAYYSELHDEIRQRVNQWIVSEEAPFDAVIPFSERMTSKEDAASLEAIYSNDGLHPSVAGYGCMAETIDLSLFENEKEPTSV